MTAFSVLIPTRDRVEYLMQSIDSIRHQDFGDWEICVADNASTDGTVELLASLSDPRIKYRRSDSLIPVTENWNAALTMSSGRYVVMLGDDDALLRGYFRIQSSVIEEFDEPDAIYSNGLLYSYPGVIPGRPAGSLQPCGSATFMRHTQSPALLSELERRQAVSDAFKFKMSYPFNMQLVLISRQLIGRLGDSPFFQSPYPDYFAMNRVLVEARRIVKIPVPLVAIGATTKSFGYFYFNGSVSKGVDFLHNRPALDARPRSVALGSSEHLDSWLLALETLQESCRGLAEVPRLRRYRQLQFARALGLLAREDERLPPSSSNLWGSYPAIERYPYIAVGWLAKNAIRLCPSALRPQARRVIARVARELARETTWRAQRELGQGFASMSDVVASIQPPQVRSRPTNHVRSQN